MSKLLNQYSQLKKEDPNKIYIFPVGIFYNILQEDAKVVSNAIGLKLTSLSPEIIKCGFPTSKIDKYTNLLKSKKLDFEIVPSLASPSHKNNVYEDTINAIKTIDLLNTSVHDLYDCINNIQQNLKNIQ